MADNGWMYNERVSATEKTDEWTRKTHFLVNELARGTKGLVRALCPCVRCVKRQRRGKDEMYRHLLQYGYMHGYVTEIDFDERERDRGEVMRQRLNGNAYDGIRDFLDDLVHADVPDSPPPEPEAPPEPEEPEPTAKAFYDMIAAAKRPLYEGAAISQLDAISQCLADKTRYNTTREGFEASLKTTGNMLPKDHCLPQSLHATRRMMKDLNMDYQRIDCCPKGCVLFWRQYAEDKYCPICKQSRYEEVTGKDGQVRQSSTAKSILRYLPFIKRIQRLYMHEETAKQMTWHKYGKRFVDENKKLKMGHPSDGTAWKNFDTKHPLKAAEARNVRIAIATDGFNPYGPHYPGKNLSVYMQPIVEDLNHSWHHGTLTEKLHMKRPIGRQKNWFKPHANFCLDSIQKKEAFRWLKYVVMFPDGYCSNMSKGVNLSTGKVTGLKSHDYHIWIQRLMPVMLRGYIPEKVWRVLAQLSHFFRTLCAKQICPKVIAKLQHTVPELLCNLEMIFPPGFFTPMAHLIVHLANEALLGGPVQFRWQFCIEREFKYIRKITGNKAKIEACIAEAICLREMADAATTYYPDDVPTQHNPVTRYNVDVPENDPKLKLFQFPGGKAGKGTKYKLENEEKDCIMLYVLMNMEEVIPFVSEFTDEMWPYDELPETSEMDTLLKEGAPGINKNFVTWFMEKGRERNVDMIDELKCVSQGCSREVTKYEKYDVNGFRFHTETHQKGRANPKTINTGVFTKGANNFDYYGRLQSVYELTFNRTNVQLNIVVFKCHWFDPIGGQRSDKSIGLVEVKPSTTYSGADVFVVAHQAKQVYYLPYPCQKAELKGWEVVFQVSPHGNLPIPSEDDYNNIDPVTYEGIFYQEEQDFGEYILEPFVQEDLGNDAETRGESVVDLKDISMLEKLLEANDNYDEPPPVDPSTLYSQDSDSDSDPEKEKEKEKETEYESERESDDGCGKADSESLLKTLAQVKRNIPRPTRRSDRAPVPNPRYDDGTDGGRGRGGRGGGRGRGGRGGGRGGGGVHMDFDEPPSASGDVAPELFLEGPSSGEVEMETESTHESDSRAELEVMEGGGAPKPLKIRGEARVPDARKEPKTHDDKALIIPSSDDNWTWEVKPARVPNSLLGALIKKFWPGRYTPLSTVPGGETRLATTWADYEDAPAVGFATAAEAVTTKFWCFYRVDPEHDTQARLTLRGACERLTPQQWYNQKVTCASAFWANKGKRVKKEYYVGNQPTEEWAMTIEEYMSVCPEWAEQHREAWEELIRARWLRQDEEFAAVLRRNMENRGTGGTHCAGSRDYTRFKGKKVAEAAPGVVLHDAEIYDMMRTKQKPHCLSHSTTAMPRPPRMTTATCPQPRPRPARPPAYDPEFEAAFEACNEAYQQAAAQWNRQNTAYMAYIGEMMISMSTGTPPPDRVTVAGDMPIMPSRAAFAATYYGSTPEGTEKGTGKRKKKCKAYADGIAVGIDTDMDHMVRSMPTAMPSA
ncbi:hypothetical protein QYE76_009511 [Lolium multiflorum]|uniref:Transposon protein, putative, CACTA, En/Spm sub-class n=1 Tax=Lolium multiflorum TaxID=4521 RepID=A0AAD8TVH4_LOLMU|nr:hypothetical protein QYE76_009511 [Lolium multiflorum]